MSGLDTWILDLETGDHLLGRPRNGFSDTC